MRSETNDSSKLNDPVNFSILNLKIILYYVFFIEYLLISKISSRSMLSHLPNKSYTHI